MTYETTELKNGLRIITAQREESQSVAVSMLAGVGSRYEQFETNGGVSHFLEHLLFKGSQKWPSTKLIAEEIDGVGGFNNAYTSNDLTNYYIKLPRQHAELAINILADMIRNPLLDPVEVDRERGVVIEEMNVFRDDPARYIHDLLPQLLWPNDPLGAEIIGSEAVIRSISRDDIAAYQQLHYGPNNLVVAVAGDIKHDDVVRQVKALMGDMTPQPVDPHPPVKAQLSDNLVRILTKDTNQAHLLIGTQAYPYNHPNDPAARIITNILGAGLSSRLFINVRERQGLAYSIYADYNSFDDSGQFDVYAGVSLDNIDRALTSVMAELERMRHEKVAETELTKVKNKMSGGLQMALENTFAIADRIGTRLLLTGQIKTPEETLADLAAVTVEDVQRVAFEMLDPKRLRLAAIVPEEGDIKERFTELTRKPHAIS